MINKDLYIKKLYKFNFNTGVFNLYQAFKTTLPKI